MPDWAPASSRLTALLQKMNPGWLTCFSLRPHYSERRLQMNSRIRDEGVLLFYFHLHQYKYPMTEGSAVDCDDVFELCSLIFMFNGSF